MERMEREALMRVAIAQAAASLRQGNSGFGAVIAKEGTIIAAAHDTAKTEHDATAHAEMNAIRAASAALGEDFTGCVLVCTHEPCPMCAGAIVWAGIPQVAFGVSIETALAQNRKRIALPCKEVFAKAGQAIDVQAGLLESECAVLYRQDVRREVDALRGIDDAGLAVLQQDSARRRLRWFAENKAALPAPGPTDSDVLNAAYALLLARLGITPQEAPVVHKTSTALTFHSCNFCPTLEACKLLELDTRHICKRLNEGSTQLLLQQQDGRLHFSRNYAVLRPHGPFCEETISLAEK